MKTPKENPDGLHGRYVVTKADGSATDPEAIYFVLRIDCQGSDKSHLAACRAAARAYADFVTSGECPHLSKIGVELRGLCDDLEAEGT